MSSELSPEAIFSVAKVMIRLLSARLLCFLALIMTFGLFSWALWAGTWVSFASAGGFALSVFLPVLWRTITKGDVHGHHD